MIWGTTPARRRGIGGNVMVLSSSTAIHQAVPMDDGSSDRPPKIRLLAGSRSCYAPGAISAKAAVQTCVDDFQLRGTRFSCR